ncbi:MAG: GGDEF domain-containing protein [Actinobacteria bacterium]|nr:MAG: GGDEF domain-containing protein [Actinomycetota bacterium]
MTPRTGAVDTAPTRAVSGEESNAALEAQARLRRSRRRRPELGRRLGLLRLRLDLGLSLLRGRHRGGAVAAAEPVVLADEESAHLRALVAPVTLAGLGAVAAATGSFTASAPSARALGATAMLLLIAIIADAFPVPLEIEGIRSSSVSLAAVFIVGMAVLYGWAPAVVIAFLTRAIVEVVQDRPTIRLVYNSSVYALGGLAAGAAASLGDRTTAVGSLLLQVLLAAAAFYVVNLLLIAAVLARSSGEPFIPLLRSSVAWTAVPFSIMASVSLMLAVLWQRSPLLSAALVGPLVAIALYQRSVHSALKAMRLALTDPLTGLGNHRHFHERLQRDLDRAQADGRPLTLCLVDIDDFKQVNDRHGHPVGDRVLAQVAGRLRQGGESFRLGGDEFAVLLPGRDDGEAIPVAEAVLQRIGSAEYEHRAPVSVSIGIATYPQHGVERSELVRVAERPRLPAGRRRAA